MQECVYVCGNEIYTKVAKSVEIAGLFTDWFHGGQILFSQDGLFLCTTQILYGHCTLHLLVYLHQPPDKMEGGREGGREGREGGREGGEGGRGGREGGEERGGRGGREGGEGGREEGKGGRGGRGGREGREEGEGRKGREGGEGGRAKDEKLTGVHYQNVKQQA